MSDGAGRRRIYLMRHGHVDYFRSEVEPRLVDLTETGRAQAAAAGEALRNAPIDIAIHSGLPRTRQTLELVLAARDGAPSPRSEPAFEELKSGWLRAKTREELAAMLAFSFDFAHEDDASFLPDGEKFADAQARIIEGLTELIQNSRWRTALIVAHEGVNRLILGWACGGGLKTVSAFEQDLGCINVIDLDATPAETGEGLKIERATIKALNVTPYDAVKDGLPRTSLEHLFEVDFGGLRPATRSDDGKKDS